MFDTNLAVLGVALSSLGTCSGIEAASAVKVSSASVSVKVSEKLFPEAIPEVLGELFDMLTSQELLTLSVDGLCAESAFNSSFLLA